MKKAIKVMEFVGDLVKALVGVLSAIGFIEIINLIISFYIGEYVRLDGGNLEIIKEGYISLGLYGYAIALIFIYCNRIDKGENKDIVQKCKNAITVSWVIIIVVNFISGIIVSDLLGTLTINIIYSAVFGLALLLIYVYDKKVINEINNKIKENK